MSEEEEDGDDEDYHETEEEQENESPATIFGANSNQQSNAFQFGIQKSVPSKSEAVSDLSNMMPRFDFNVSSPFHFGSPTITEVIYQKSPHKTSISFQNKTNKWLRLNNLDKVKEHLKVTEIIDRTKQCGMIFL